jgi:hypothetical protein
MAKNSPRLTVTLESKSGMNQKFRDNLTGETLTRTGVAHKIDRGDITNYHYYRDNKGQLVIRSNPDGNTRDNLN